MNRRFLSIVSLLVIPDIVLAGYLLMVFRSQREALGGFLLPLLLVVCALLFIKIAILIILGKYYYLDRIGFIKRIIAEFKKGKYYMPRFSLKGRDELAGVFRDLTVIGKHFEDIVSTQKGEIEQLREMYNNIVLSMSSYFLVLDEDEDVLFANESFCRKFQYQQGELYGKNIEEVFYFLTGRVREAIGALRATGESIVLEKTHLLSKKRISVIADIKISRMVVQGRNQIIMVIDDITNRCRKDYQITLLSQISESIRRDEELDEVLFTILTGVTSGSGLGFNRAMLFLVDEKEPALVGRMAVGPDSMDEAIEIWSSLPSGKVDLLDQFVQFFVTNVPVQRTGFCSRLKFKPQDKAGPPGLAAVLAAVIEDLVRIEHMLTQPLLDLGQTLSIKPVPGNYPFLLAFLNDPGLAQLVLDVDIIGAVENRVNDLLTEYISRQAEVSLQYLSNIHT